MNTAEKAPSSIERQPSATSSVFWDAEETDANWDTETATPGQLPSLDIGAANESSFHQVAENVESTSQLEVSGQNATGDAYDTQLHDQYVQQMNWWCMVFCCQCGGACCGCFSKSDVRKSREDIRRKTLERQAVMIGEMLSAYEFGLLDKNPEADESETPRTPFLSLLPFSPRSGKRREQPDELVVRRELTKRFALLFDRSPRSRKARKSYPVLLPQDWLRGVQLYILLGAFADEPDRMQRLCMSLPPLPVARIQWLHHWMRFAAAPLGQYLLMLERPASAFMNYPKSFYRALRTRSTPDSALLAVARRCRVGLDRILLAQMQSQTFLPAFIIVEDPVTDSLVVSVRGTMSVSDAFTDLEGTPAHFEVYCCEGSPAGSGVVITGTAHGGLLKSGTNLCKRILPTLARAAERRGGHPRIIVTGHSLGGGAAALLAIMLQAHLPNVHAVCFAPPPAVSIEAAEKCKAFMECVVRGNDSVPRMSLPAIAHFLRIAYLGKFRLNRMQRLALFFRCGWLCKFPQEIREEVKRVTYSLENRRMFLPGRVFYITEPSERNTCGDNACCGPVCLIGACEGRRLGDKDQEALMHHRLIREIDARELRCLVGRKGIIEHHMPWGYERALRALLRDANAPSLRRKEMEERKRLSEQHAPEEFVV
jgi:pimeloyl-ACP methyl ester carboxylesterase